MPLRLFRSLCILTTLLSLSGYPSGTIAQQSQTAQVSLRVGGEVERQLSLTSDDLAKLPHRTIRAKDHDGKESEFEGVPLVEVLTLAGVSFGEKMRGEKLALFLLVEAADGYRSVFALPELDPAFTDKLVLLANRRDGKSLSSKEGPLWLIVPDEKRHARWVRQVTALTVRRA